MAAVLLRFVKNNKNDTSVQPSEQPAWPVCGHAVDMQGPAEGRQQDTPSRVGVVGPTRCDAHKENSSSTGMATLHFQCSTPSEYWPWLHEYRTNIDTISSCIASSSGADREALKQGATPAAYNAVAKLGDAWARFEQQSITWYCNPCPSFLYTFLQFSQCLFQ